MGFFKNLLGRFSKTKPVKPPTTIEAAITHLYKQMIHAEYIEPDEHKFLAMTHHAYGMQIRNEWQLWNKESELVHEFNELGIWHADDMSSILFRSAHRKLHGEDMKIWQQIGEFHQYWQRQGVNPLTGERS